MIRMKSRKNKKRPGFKENEKAKFELRFYAGYKGEEIPKAVIIGSREFVIDKVLSRKRVLDKKSGKTLEVFKCRMEGKPVVIKVHESGEWEIIFSCKNKQREL
jgi:hypothetical protein